MSIKSMDRVRSLAREAWAEEARDVYARGIALRYERLLAAGREDDANAVFAPAPDFVVPRGAS